MGQPLLTAKTQITNLTFLSADTISLTHCIGTDPRCDSIINLQLKKCRYPNHMNREVEAGVFD